MPQTHAIFAQIDRLGELATVHTRQQDGSDAFNNTEWTYLEDREIPCVRTYPNRNTESESNTGTLERDRPLFVFPQPNPRRGQPAPPSEKDRLEYNGVMYDLASRTEYDTHVAIFGNKLDN